jgi:hypothetical protein
LQRGQKRDVASKFLKSAFRVIAYNIMPNRVLVKIAVLGDQLKCRDMYGIKM